MLIPKADEYVKLSLKNLRSSFPSFAKDSYTSVMKSWKKREKNSSLSCMSSMNVLSLNSMRSAPGGRIALRLSTTG